MVATGTEGLGVATGAAAPPLPKLMVGLAMVITAACLAGAGAGATVAPLPLNRLLKKLVLAFILLVMKL